MSGEIEAAGVAATAGLAAGAIEGREPLHAGEGACANCGAALGGKFCSECGQAAHVHRTLAHLVEESLHGVLHFDTKIWRTLPKLFLRPGTLSRDYIEGKRARYVSPLALFLFTVFLTFAAFTLAGNQIIPATGAIAAPQNRAEAGGALRARAAEALAERARTTDDGERRRLGALAQTLTAAADRAALGEAPSGNLSAAISEAARTGDLSIETGDAARDAAIRHKLENPDLLFYKMQQAAYKLAFLLVPIALPFVALLFLFKKDVTFYDHAVFTLYALSALFLFGLAMLVAGRAAAWAPWIDAPLDWAWVALPLAHIFFHLHGAYRLSWFSAGWRTLALTASAGLVFTLFALLVVLVGFFG